MLCAATMSYGTGQTRRRPKWSPRSRRDEETEDRKQHTEHPGRRTEKSVLHTHFIQYLDREEMEQNTGFKRHENVRVPVRMKFSMKFRLVAGCLLGSLGSLVLLAFASARGLPVTESYSDSLGSSCEEPKSDPLVGAERIKDISRTRHATRALLPVHLRRGKIALPRHTRRVKISIGESYSAPNSALWFSSTSDPDQLTVFAFEPNPTSCRNILKGCACSTGGLCVPLDLVGKRYFLSCVAMGSSPLHLQTFYATAGDPGTSSLHKPVKFDVQNEIQVPVWNLHDFFTLLPWSASVPKSESLGVQGGSVQYIDMLKIDAQGHDLEIIKGARHWLSERVVWIQPELVVTGYANQHGEHELRDFITSLGFTYLPRGLNHDCPDDLFLNMRFRHMRHVAQVLCLGQ